MWEDQRIVARPRYRDLIEALRFVARQELIFGMHVHIGLDDPEKAIHVPTGCGPRARACWR
jgi:carboxylate-amine ligase